MGEECAFNKVNSYVEGVGTCNSHESYQLTVPTTSSSSSSLNGFLFNEQMARTITWG